MDVYGVSGLMVMNMCACSMATRKRQSKNKAENAHSRVDNFHKHDTFRALRSRRGLRGEDTRAAREGR